MSKLLKFAGWILVLVVLALWALSALSTRGNSEAAALLDDVKRGAQQAEEAVNDWVEDSGIKEGAQDAARKASEWLEGAAGTVEDALTSPAPETV